MVVPLEKFQAVPVEKAAFVPSEGVKRGDDGTVLWQPTDNSGVKELISGLRQHVGKLTRRQVFTIGIALLTVGLAALSLTGPKARAMTGQNSGSAHPMPLAPKEGPGQSLPEKPRPARRGPPPTPLIPVGSTDGGPTLGAAADALLEGRLTEAMALYRLLAERYPENRSFALAADILASAKTRGGHE